MSTPAAPPANATIAELLCAAADAGGRPPHQVRALRRAGRAALRWPIEARDLVAHNRSLTELRGVGPWLARIIGDWLTDPPPASPLPLRVGFVTRTQVDAILATDGPRARGDLQMHTLDSDGTAPLAAMAEAGLQRGLQYLAITDHSKGLPIANGMSEARLEQQGTAISELNDRLRDRGLRVLRSVEMNLSPRGEGDLDPAFLARLDVVLGAFHSRLRLTEDQTERYLAAVANPHVDILAHPRGRIFNFRLGLSADWERVFDHARRHRCAVEIDAFPDRQDLDVGLLARARDAGVLISIGSDAHAPWQLEFLDFGIAATRRAGIPAHHILNCWGADDLLAWTAEGAAPRSVAERGSPSG